MLDYATAARLYEGRKDKHIGRKVHNRVYMKHDPTRDCFVVSELWSKYEHVPDPNRPGKTKYQKAPKKRWTLHPIAEVYRDHIVILRALHNTPMYALFRVESFASRTVKLSGCTWVYTDSAGRSQKINGDLPIMIKDDTLTPMIPPRVRVFDHKKRNEMNRMIQSIRNMIRVRAKLGAFDKLTPAQISEYIRQTPWDSPWHSKWQVLYSPSRFIALMQAVDPENLKSFYPLLWLMSDDWHYYRNSNENFGYVDWVARYNSLVNRMREKMRRELGVVDYVVEPSGWREG